MSSHEGAVMLAALPHVWAVLAVDARLRCREVCVGIAAVLGTTRRVSAELATRAAAQ